MTELNNVLDADNFAKQLREMQADYLTYFHAGLDTDSLRDAMAKVMLETAIPQLSMMSKEELQAKVSELYDDDSPEQAEALIGNISRSTKKFKL